MQLYITSSYVLFGNQSALNPSLGTARELLCPLLYHKKSQRQTIKADKAHFINYPGFEILPSLRIQEYMRRWGSLGTILTGLATPKLGYGVAEFRGSSADGGALSHGGGVADSH